MPLPVKIQYKNFEPGEFTGKTDRTLEETTALIEQFPWAEQRDHLQVSLTNPSITIEDPEGNYLKLALYYEGKFVLHYFNTQNHLYTKSFTSYTDAYPYIQSFFLGNLDADALKSEITWGQNPSLHFTDQDFNYTSRNAWTLSNLILPVLLGTMLLSLAVAAAMAPGNMASNGMQFLPLFIIFFFPSSLYFSLFFNHCHFIKDKLLILSKGHDIFYYGNKDAPEEFNKDNIVEIIAYGYRGRSASQSGLLRIAISFKNGRYIELSTLLIDKSRLMGKLQGCTCKDVNRFLPFMPLNS